MSRRRTESPTAVTATFADMRSDYAAMQPSRFRRDRPGASVGGMGGGGKLDADAHTSNEWNFVAMREYARAMWRDDSIIKSLVRRVVHNVVRTGFRYEPQTGDKTLDRDLWQRWDDWSRDKRECDAAGVMTFADYERLVVEHEIVDGDVFIVGTNEGCLQPYEADRCTSPTKRSATKRNLVHGVELDERRRRLSFWMRKQTPGLNRLYNLVGDFDQIAAYDADGESLVWHVMDFGRFTQTRGVTAFHPIFDKAGMYEDVDFALLVKQQMAAFLAWEEQTTGDYPADVQYGARERTPRRDGSIETVEQIAAGSIVRTPKGKTLKMHQTSVADSDAMAHLRNVTQVLSINLGLPLCAAMLDASETNFTGWRGAMDQAKLGFITNQERYETRFHRECLRWKIRDWMATDAALTNVHGRLGRRGRPIDAFRHKWFKPRWPYPQPLQDSEANGNRLETGQASLTQIHAELGNDGDDVISESVRDNERWIRKSIKAAQRIRKAFPEDGKDVHWSHLYHRALPKGATSFDAIDVKGAVDAEDQAGAAGKKGTAA